MGDLRILAFDTSGPHCAASLVINGAVVASVSEEMKKGQAERLMPMLDELMASEGAVWAELDAIGVGVGPGNFTGIRIAVAAARGLSLALGKPAIGVSTFEALRGPEWWDGDGAQIVVLPSSRRGHDVVAQRFEHKKSVGNVVEGSLNDGLAHAFSTNDFRREITSVIGHRAEEFSAWVGGTETPIEVAFSDGPRDRLTDRIGLVAALKLADGAPIPRPAPLYVRPADAAPASDPPPVILP